MDAFANGFNLDMILDMLRRRRWIAVALFSLVITVTGSLIMFLPNIYTASALILVEGQQVPQEFVRSTVTMGVDRRLQTINQEILSRSRLDQLAEQFGLYQDLRQQGAESEVIAAAMRRDIGIQIRGRNSGMGTDTVAFEVNYTGPDPEKVAQVANTLASFYIEENLKVRERQALGTSEFLRNELAEVKQKLEEQEQQVIRYKQQHMGELPEQFNANLTTLGVLQKQMEILSDNLARARERRNVLAQMAEMDAALTSLDTGNPGAAGDARVGSLKGQLAELRTRFSDKHPDVIRVKQLLARLEEEQLKSQAESASSGDAALSLSPSGTTSATQVEQAAIDAEIQRVAADFNKVRSDIAMYQQRIENTPKREQELLAVSRDYNTTRDLYTSLLKRLDEANLSDSLEQRQKAERFKLLEPAVYPQAPAAPKRVRFLLVGLALGLGAAAAGVFLREMLDASFHRVEDLKAFSKVPVLVTIPQIVTQPDRAQRRRRQFLGAAALAASLLMLVGASYRVAAGNEALVRYFVSPATGSQVRQ